MGMKTSDAGVDVICLFEGFSSEPYLCPANVWTYAYGSTRDFRGNPVHEQTTPISEPDARSLLGIELAQFERRVRRLLPIDLEQHQFDPILSFTYNLGAGALQASTLRKKILRYDMDGAAREFDRWVFAGGRKLAGLVRRRAAERDMFEG
jgi:lysozyme